MDTEKRVSYKGIMVPARELDVGKGKVKLVPVKTDRYTLHGVPMPNKLEMTNEIIETATNILALNRSSIGKKASVLIRYIRKGRDGYVLASSATNKDTREYFVAKGEPYGAVVAFLHEGCLKIGWSKRLEGKKLKHGKQVQREPLSFTKKDAICISIIRGLVDTLTFRGSNIFTSGDDVIPKAIAKVLPEFIEHAEKYFNRIDLRCDAINVYKHTPVVQSGVEKECPPFNPGVEKECPPFNKNVGTT